MNKSVVTNLVALAVVVTGLLMTGPQQQLVLNTGLFALSGGITNWLAIYMLFEKIPGFYGSGVIPAQFEEFKHGIKHLIMEQFFNAENISNFLSKQSPDRDSDTPSVVEQFIEGVDLNEAFKSLVEVIMNSSFAGMLAMVGGEKALEPLEEPFVKKMKEFMAKVGNDSEILAQATQTSAETILSKVERIVDHRLEELTPELVKDIIQQMIQKHLGWLVVWGGVLGGLIGLVVTLGI